MKLRRKTSGGRDGWRRENDRCENVVDSRRKRFAVAGKYLHSDINKRKKLTFQVYVEKGNGSRTVKRMILSSSGEAVKLIVK